VLQVLVTAAVVPSSLNLSTLMMEAIRSSEMSVLTQVTRRHIPEDGILQNVLKHDSPYVLERMIKLINYVTIVLAVNDCLQL
jgi:hypothetical protein